MKLAIRLKGEEKIYKTLLDKKAEKYLTDKGFCVDDIKDMLEAGQKVQCQSSFAWYYITNN
jgi:SOS response regulatory protein OraA/RecX